MPEALYFHMIVVNAIDNVTISSPVTHLVVKTDQLTSTMACKIDTGAEGNVLPIEKYHELDELYSPAVITSGDKKAVRDKIIHKIKILII